MSVTGRRIIRAILDGERDPVCLAKLRDRRCKRDEATIALALHGHWRDEHLFELSQAVALFDMYHEKIAECDRRIEAHLRTFADQSGGSELVSQPRRRKRARNEPDFDLRGHLFRMTGVDLTTIDGIDAHTALITYRISLYRALGGGWELERPETKDREVSWQLENPRPDK